MHDDTQRSAGRGSVTGGKAHQPFDQPGAKPSMGGHPHGKRSSWVLTALVIIAFLAGGTGLIMHFWWLFWVCVGVVVLSVPVGKAIGIMNDTVVWGSTPGHDEAELPGRAHEHAQHHPAVARPAAGQPAEQDSER